MVVLNEKQWDKFNKILNRPAKIIPKLKKLFEEKSIFTQQRKEDQRMENYMVTVRDALGELHNILCKDRGEVSNLLNHLDDDKYSILDVKVLNTVSSDIKHFCKKENLETGGK